MQIVLESHDIDINVFSNPGEPPHHLGLEFVEGMRDPSGRWLPGAIKIPVVLDRMTALALAAKMQQALGHVLDQEPPPAAEPVYGNGQPIGTLEEAIESAELEAGLASGMIYDADEFPPAA